MKAALRQLGTLVTVLVALSMCGCGGDDPPPLAVAPTPTPAMADPIGQLPTDATIQLPGLGSATDVVFDDLGIPHVYAADLDSGVFVQGYLTAQARFWEMDVFRRFAEGRLCELFGRATLEADVRMRTEFTTRDGRRLEEAFWEHVQRLDPEGAKSLQAYAAGVNTWLDDLKAGRNGATLPPEYELDFIIDLTAADLEPWRPQDTLAIARLQAWSLSQSMDEEVSRSRILQALPDALARDVFRSAPAAPATVLPAADGGDAGAGSADAAHLLPVEPSLEVLDALARARTATDHWNPLGTAAQGLGSNNWIVAPALSSNGHAMLANDPHLALYNPPIWHMIQLDTGMPGGGRNRVNGVIFPGIPGVILGHNDFGAWGGTVAVFDVTDVYVETVTTPPNYPQAPRTVLFNGQQVPVLRIEEVFRPKGFPPVTQVVEIVPHHGPMVPDPNIGDSVVGLAATGMSFRWTGFEMSNEPRFLLDLNRAHNVDEFRAALRNFGVGAQNWVWADISGDIAYFPKVLIPQRPAGTVPYLPLPGTGEAEWLTDGDGKVLWLPDEKIPQATNPAEGFLATANNDQIGNTLDNDPLNDAIYLTYSADLGFREERVQDLLSNRANVRPAGAKITLEDMSRYQYDSSSKEAARLLPFLFAAAETRPDLVSSAMSEAIARLEAWGDQKPGSAPYEMASGVDPATLRNDIPPRSTPVSDEERADAVAASLFAAWTTRLAPAVFADDFAGTGVGSPGGADATKALLHILEDGERTDAGFRVYTMGASGESTLWDNRSTPEVESRDEILLRALANGLTFLETRFASAATDDWLWGMIHRVNFQHFVGQAGIGVFDLGPFAAPGGRFTVNPANYSLNTSNFTFTGGPSMRFVAVLDPTGIRAVNSLPGGNYGNPGRPVTEDFNRIQPDIHYGDHISDWINGQTFDYRVTRSDVAAHARRKVRYTE